MGVKREEEGDSIDLRNGNGVGNGGDGGGGIEGESDHDDFGSDKIICHVH